MHCRPSEIMDIEDAYTAFCFDEACAFIISQLRDGKKPIVKDTSKQKVNYKRPSDLYKRYK